MLNTVTFIDKIGTVITLPYEATGSSCRLHWPCESCLSTLYI